ncbi:nuclear pore complex subunit [Friedmanniomyces endolithicus]|uniref:Nuclear pore complex subunit n=1 Tax=Friedmanniomyces endolithicus TaxID=329885 RepID=A0AAN6FA04_9PEZI|nr:nuclear pore complex subunit [Friedmanniomyces endolithicus]
MADLFSRITPRDAAPAQNGGGGMFGGAAAAAPATTRPTGASLFSMAPTSTTGGGGGLFGATASTGGGLFGGTAATTTSQPASTGMFKSLASAAPLGNGLGNLFGGTSNAPMQPAATGSSLFGNTFRGNTQTSQPTGASLSGGAAPSQAANSLFASTANDNIQAQGNANASVFGTNVLPSQQSLQQPLVQRAYDPNVPAAQPSYFQALLDKGNKRMVEDKSGLPQLQYGLQDIQRKVRNVGQGGPSAGLGRGGAANTRSQYVLAASGVNVGESLRDIESLMDITSTARAQAAAPDVPDYSAMSGVKDFLGEYHRNNFQEMIDSRLQQAQDDFNKMVDEQLHMQPVDWQRYRNRIDVHFGLRKPDENGDEAADNVAAHTGSFGRSRRSRMHGSSAFGLPDATRSVIGTPGPNGMRQSTFNDVADKLPSEGIRPAPEDRTQRVKQDRYSGKVKDLNVARILESVYPIMTRFAEVEAEPSNEDTSMLVNAYKALIRITGEDASKENVSEPGVVKERQYAQSYLDESSASKRQGSVRKQIIDGSRKFLESQFYDQLKATVARSPREANIGGVPTSVAEVKGYVRVRAARKELGPDIEILQEINGDYCWAVIFYMLRAGLNEQAAQYLNENAAAFKQIDRKFIGYLRAYISSAEHRLTPDMQTAISNEYSTRQRLAPENSIDPYRMMCYKIVGRCDLSHRSLDAITNDMMDWMWLQFALAREYDKREELAHEAFGLDDLRLSIKEIGERYFGSSSEIANAPTTFFFMQILAGMFEKAVADLYPHNYVSATHFAIALDFYGLLRVSGDLSNDDLLSYTTRQQPQIAFGSLIGLYTRDFRTANATAAVDYLTLICLNADLTGDIGKAQKELCYQALIEVVLETREFAQLLGDVRSDGQRIKGAVEQRLKLIKLDNEKEFLKHITVVAARTAEDQSRTTDAALLFHLAEDYDKVIQVVNDAVSVYLTTEIGEQPARLVPLKPRNQQQLHGVQPQDERLSSLSLTAIDDPVELAVSMRTLYMTNDVYVTKIQGDNLEITNRLLTLASARKNLEQNRFAEVIDDVTTSNLLPAAASGNLSAIRARAQAFDQMPAVLARTVGHVMLWTVVACRSQADKLRRAEFETGFQREAIERCVQTAKDVVVFAGLVRYRLPGRVWEMLAMAGQEGGGY